MLQRYSMAIIYGRAGYSPCKNDDGEWVKWVDVRDEIQKLELKLEQTGPIRLGSKSKCLKVIHLPDTKGIASTYCMRDEGHEGNCA